MTLDDLIDGCWYAMRGSLFRRAILGRQRCSQLVLITISMFPDRELEGCTPGSAYERQKIRDLATAVERKYRSNAAAPSGTYEAVFLSIVLAWAIKAIVLWLLDQWLKQQFSPAEIRQRYGWA